MWNAINGVCISLEHSADVILNELLFLFFFSDYPNSQLINTLFRVF